MSTGEYLFIVAGLALMFWGLKRLIWRLAEVVLMSADNSISSGSVDAPENLLRGWAKAYRDSPEHRFPSDPNAEFFPVDLETAADEIERLRGVAQQPAKPGPLVPWELDCQRAAKDCAAPVCDCPPVK